MDHHTIAGLHEAILSQAARTPDAVAVVDRDGQLTYRLLVERASAIAGLVRAHGVRPDDTVAVVLDRSVTLPAVLLGILAAGAAYVPLELDTPAARMTQIVQDAGVRLGVAVDDRATNVLRDAGCSVLHPGAEPAVALSPEPVLVRPDSLCSLYYTSGSTGRPKGVASTHRGWLNRMAWMQRRHNLGRGEAVLQKTTLTFDDAAVEVFWPLMVGATVAMLPAGLHRDPRAIAEYAIRFCAVHLNFVPSVLELFLDGLTDDDLVRLSSLRSVLTSGEALRPALAGRFFERFGDRVSLDNTWGATECSIDSTCHPCGPADAASPAPAVSLGRPIDGNEVFVLDAMAQPVPDGESGELYIGGVSLARGYHGDPAATAAAFLPHPWRPGDRIYRTGDRGRRQADGSIEFDGRRDRQVKIRGVRIELGEVESVLRGAPGIADVAVMVREAGPDDVQIACFVAAEPDAAVSPAALGAYARRFLPEYAVPSSILVDTVLPRLPSGKLDWEALRTVESRPSGGTGVAPRTPTEQAVAGIWAGVLGVTGMAATDDFFARGGHSLLAMRATAQMIRSFGVEIPVRLIFDHRTVEAAALHVEELVTADVEELSNDEVIRLSRT
jgi:amino acid adenylation domain-containing protein